MDFGLAGRLPAGKEGRLFTQCGTPSYVAPEVFSEQGYDCKADMFSAGVVAFTLLAGYQPFRVRPAASLYLHLSLTTHDNLVPFISLSCACVAAALLPRCCVVVCAVVTLAGGG